MPNIYGPHIKAVRVERGIKAAYVARRLTISSPTYSEIESGKRGVSAERLDQILTLINLPMKDLKAMVRTHAQLKKVSARASNDNGVKNNEM